jgi:hypothetical protein
MNESTLIDIYIKNKLDVVKTCFEFKDTLPPNIKEKTTIQSIINLLNDDKTKKIFKSIMDNKKTIEKEYLEMVQGIIDDPETYYKKNYDKVYDKKLDNYNNNNQNEIKNDITIKII